MGRISESEAEKIESTYFAHPQGVDEVWETFGDLAEEYLDGALSAVESKLFEERLRSSAAFREIFANEKALFESSAGTMKRVLPQAPPDPVRSKAGRSPFFPRATFSNQWGLAFASLLALVALTVWFMYKSRPHTPSPGPQTTATHTISPDKIELSNPTQRTPEIGSPGKKTLAEERKPPRPVADDLKSGPVATFLFSATPVRDGQPDLQMKISSQTVFLLLEFELSSDDCPIFSATLKTESDQPIQQWAKLRPRRDHSASKVSVRLRADLLRNDTYAVSLECASDRENPASSQQYHFRVEKEALR